MSTAVQFLLSSMVLLIASMILTDFCSKKQWSNIGEKFFFGSAAGIAISAFFIIWGY